MHTLALIFIAMQIVFLVHRSIHSLGEEIATSDCLRGLSGGSDLHIDCY
jgi:hypothetical protein